MVVEVEVFSSCQKLPLPNNNSRALAALWRRACRAALELGIPSPARIQPLHLPGGLKFDPPGSTRRWCCLSSPKLSKRRVVGARARSAMCRVRLCTTFGVGGKVALPVGRAGGGSSGLSGGGATVGGACVLPSGGGVRGRSFSYLGSGSLSRAVVLGMGAALVSSVSVSDSMVLLLLLVLVSRERAVSAMVLLLVLSNASGLLLTGCEVGGVCAMSGAWSEM